MSLIYKVVKSKRIIFIKNPKSNGKTNSIETEALKQAWNWIILNTK